MWNLILSKTKKSEKLEKPDINSHLKFWYISLDLHRYRYNTIILRQLCQKVNFIQGSVMLMLLLHSRWTKKTNWKIFLTHMHSIAYKKKYTPTNFFIENVNFLLNQDFIISRETLYNQNILLGVI